MIVLICSSILAKENSSFLITILPDSMRDISSISLMMPSRCSADVLLFLRYSFTLSDAVGSFMAMLFKPMMAFMGVRISWLMLDRNVVLALLASSAMVSASARASFLAIDSRTSASISVRPRPMECTMWSSRSSTRRTPAMRIIS